MFAHAVSLRWALYSENRLEYNTNIRLLSSSREFGPNRWYVNIMVLFSLILTYAASSLMFLYSPSFAYCYEGITTSHDYTIVNGVAVLSMGVGLAGQAAVAIWCLMASRRMASIPVLTWSANPRNTTLAAVHQGYVTCHQGRCLLFIFRRHQQPAQGVYPGMYRAQRSVPFIVAALWGLAALASAWPVAIAFVSRSMSPRSFKFELCRDTLTGCKPCR